MMYECTVGIDPDVDRSGVAVVFFSERRIALFSMAFHQLVDCFQAHKGDTDTQIVIEAGWKNANNWHLTRMMSNKAASKAGENVGRNMEVARKIAEMSRHYGLATYEVRPLKKRWRGPGGKITHEEIQTLLRCSGFEPARGRTNQEERDALLLALVYSGVPLKYRT